MYKVILSTKAHSFYSNSQLQLAKKLARCFSFLEKEPYKSNNIKKLSGKFRNYYRYRIGDCRVIYRIDENRKEVIVVLIKHRADVYKSRT
jgi:mRNA interferase RelE/StbE